MVLLPSLVFSAKVKGSRVLEVRGKDNGLVTSFARKLNAKVPGFESNENELEIVAREMFGGEGVKPINCVPERASVSNVLPSQGCQARWWKTV